MTVRSSLVLAGLTALAALIPARPATACDLAIAFAVDVSASVDADRFEVQMRGLADGLRDPLIADELVRAEARVMLVQWSGHRFQRVSIPWTAIRSDTEVRQFADAVEDMPRAWSGNLTAIGSALEIAAVQFDAATECRRRVLDVSGNGPGNDGPDPVSPSRGLAAAGVTVNAIVLETRGREVAEYYASNVIAGPGAFVLSVQSPADFSHSMREKLLRELSIQFVDQEGPGLPQG